MNWIALDIGGANIKAADGHGWARSVSFALWREPAGVSNILRELIISAPPFQRLAVTMTGELCDCFRTKAEGVQQILTAVESAAPGAEMWVYLVDGRLATVVEACEAPQLAAASNWHALARFACRFVDEWPAVLIDIGSTTTDVVSLVDGCPYTKARSDTERLLAGELVYTGVGRTPVCAVVHTLPWDGQPCPVAAELFATTADAYVLLGDLNEDRDATWTADGRPLTREFAIERMARMVCADRVQFGAQAAVEAAGAVRDAQLARLRIALRRVTERLPAAPASFLTSGKGEFLARRLVADAVPAARVVSLAQYLGTAVSECAPAHALAVLAAETGGLCREKS